MVRSLVDRVGIRFPLLYLVLIDGGAMIKASCRQPLVRPLGKRGK